MKCLHIEEKSVLISRLLIPPSSLIMDLLMLVKEWQTGSLFEKRLDSHRQSKDYDLIWARRLQELVMTAESVKI